MALFSPLRGQAIALEVRFKLTDLQYRPIAGDQVRVVLSGDPAWQAAGAGHACTTDAVGEATFTAPATLDRRWRSPSGPLPPALPTLPQATDHLMVATELAYAGHHWLYVVDLCRFRDGVVLQDGFEVFTPDAKGRFSMRAVRNGREWRMADLGGLALTAPGHEPWNTLLEPLDLTAKPPRWRLTLAFKRAPEPLRR